MLNQTPRHVKPLSSVGLSSQECEIDDLSARRLGPANTTAVSLEGAAN